MPHTKANRVRVLTEQLHQAQKDRADALQERDKALAELAVLKESRRHERQSLEIISRVYDKQALEEARAALADTLAILDDAISDLAEAYPNTARRYQEKVAALRATLPADR